MATDTVEQQRFTSDDFDTLTEKTTKLNALLIQTYGDDSGSGFRNTSDEIQDAYLWACSDIAGEIKALVEKLVHSPGRL
ncbi:MAG: hypothetical protein I8H67_13680 [Comamonadaceae bacterium]|nr:hypothetical protein [Comamonadaceae bacterium]